VKLKILSERMVKNGGTCSSPQSLHEKLIVKWETCGKSRESGQVSDVVEKITSIVAGSRRANDEFSGLFKFEFDEEGRVIIQTKGSIGIRQQKSSASQTGCWAGHGGGAKKALPVWHLRHARDRGRPETATNSHECTHTRARQPPKGTHTSLISPTYPGTTLLFAFIFRLRLLYTSFVPPPIPARVAFCIEVVTAPLYKMCNHEVTMFL
jgi:hypothetical protein